MRSADGTSIGSHPCRMTTSKRGSAVLNARWLGSASRLSSPTPTLPLPACWRLVLTVMCRRSVLSFAPTLRPSTPCERHSWSCERPRWSRDGKHARVSPRWALAWHRSPRYSRRSEAWSQGEVRLRAADRPAGRITELRLALAEAIAGVSFGTGEPRHRDAQEGGTAGDDKGHLQPDRHRPSKPEDAGVEGGPGGGVDIQVVETTVRIGSTT